MVFPSYLGTDRKLTCYPIPGNLMAESEAMLVDKTFREVSKL